MTNKTGDERVIQRIQVPVTMAQPPQEDADTGDVTFWAVAVDAGKTVNRLGLRFKWADASGVKLDNFMRNPTMLNYHDSDALPVGRFEKVDVTKTQVKMFGRIPGGPDYEDLAPLRVRVRDGYLKAVSIGFYINKSNEVKDKSGDVIGLEVTEFEIVECSLCSIGAHPTAIIGQKLADYATGDWADKDYMDIEQGGWEHTEYEMTPDVVSTTRVVLEEKSKDTDELAECQKMLAQSQGIIKELQSKIEHMNQAADAMLATAANRPAVDTERCSCQSDSAITEGRAKSGGPDLAKLATEIIASDAGSEAIDMAVRAKLLKIIEYHRSN